MIDDGRAGTVGTVSERGDGGGPVDVIEAAIRSRRSVKRFLPRPVARELVTRLLDAAVWAPNHRLTEPWRFHLLDGASRERVGALAGELARAKAERAGAASEAASATAAAAAAGWNTVPVLLYVTALRDENSELDLENYGAVCCALQNLLLLAHASGLGMSWSSGAVAASEELRRIAGAGEDERMVGLLRLGYPDPLTTPGRGRRQPAATVTRWLDPEPPD